MDKETLKRRCEDTLAAMEAHERGEPVEMLFGSEWEHNGCPSFKTTTREHYWYRPKRKPRVVWVEISESGTAEIAWTQEELDGCEYDASKLTKFIEVIEGND